MIFNSIDFAIFLPIVFILYWFVLNKNLKVQNFLIAIASYFFYGWWDWRFLSLILFSSIVDYTIGIQLKKENRVLQRKGYLWISIVVNLGLLGFFKYYNFFLDNFVEAYTFFGTNIKVDRLDIILPVGISFYTFQTLSYTIDVYRKKLTPTSDFIAFSAFVSFFPQLVAGPIERATNLLPQFYKKRSFNYTLAVDGLRQILLGLFKKVVIANNCAVIANQIFDNYEIYSGSTLILGAILFSFQIYGDFSGYSDIAIGISRLFGFNLMQNFAFPYFSRDIAEFWRRWHISLSTWFRDYLYIPIGGSRGSKMNQIRNVFAIFIVSGFWHGANWTFLVWGGLNALYFLPLLLFNRNRKNKDVVAENLFIPSLKDFFKIIFTFTLTVIAWVFFRAENITHALSFIYRIFKYPYIENISFSNLKITLVLLFVFIILEWLGRKKKHILEGLEFLLPNNFLRATLYLIFIFLIILFKGEPQEFIYFQF